MSDKIKTSEFKVRQCTQADFGVKNIDYFKLWEGYSIVCPAMEPDEFLEMWGARSDTFQNSFSIEIAMCDTFAIGNKCKLQKQI